MEQVKLDKITKNKFALFGDTIYIVQTETTTSSGGGGGGGGSNGGDGGGGGSACGDSSDGVG